MNKIVILVLIILVIFLTRREGFTEVFGMSGYNKPVDNVRLDDPIFDKTGYKRVEAMVDSDLIDKLVKVTNDEILRRTGLYTYIIETTALKHYKTEDDAQLLSELNEDIQSMNERAKLIKMMGDVTKIEELQKEIARLKKRYDDLKNMNDIYECMFMVVRDTGFSFGFSVVSTIHIKNGVASIKSIRSQPIDAQNPSNINPYIDDMCGKDFVDYKLVDEISSISKGEFDSAKNKLM
jgi:hypothetical protein